MHLELVDRSHERRDVYRVHPGAEGLLGTFALSSDSDPCFTDNQGISRNTFELEEYLRSLPVAQGIVEFEHSPPYTQF